MHHNRGLITAQHSESSLPFSSNFTQAWSSPLTSVPEKFLESKPGTRGIPFSTQRTNFFDSFNHPRPRILVLAKGITGSRCVPAELSGQGPRVVCLVDKGRRHYFLQMALESGFLQLLVLPLSGNSFTSSILWSFGQ